jgi:hypothetical protein
VKWSWGRFFCFSSNLRFVGPWDAMSYDHESNGGDCEWGTPSDTCIFEGSPESPMESLVAAYIRVPSYYSSKTKRLTTQHSRFVIFPCYAKYASFQWTSLGTKSSEFVSNSPASLFISIHLVSSHSYQLISIISQTACPLSRPANTPSRPGSRSTPSYSPAWP